jgi:hypothetical protein
METTPHRLVNRLTHQKHEKLTDFFVRSLAQGRLTNLTDVEIANLCTAGLGFPVTIGNVKGVRRELDLRKEQGHSTFRSVPNVPVTSCDRSIRIAAMRWLMFLDHADLLPDSPDLAWSKLTVSPDSSQFYLETEHGPIVARISTWLKEPA